VVVGLVGCGSWGRHILRDLLALECEVPVVARSDESRARAIEGGASAIVPDVGSLPSVDGVVVATPTSTHASVLADVLELETPVFCETPLSDDPALAAELAERADGRLFVMDKWRYHPAIRELAAIARDRRLGPVAGIRSLRIGWGNPHDDVDAVWVLAPHDLSIALEIMGELARPEAAKAQQVAGELVHLTALLAGEGWWHALELSAYSPERMRRVVVQCAEGVAYLADGWDEHVTVARESAGGRLEEERIETPGELPLLAELRTFVEHLRGGPAPRSSAREGAAAVATIAELRRLALQ
jgi:predicted dehydrogenase